MMIKNVAVRHLSEELPAMRAGGIEDRKRIRAPSALVQTPIVKRQNRSFGAHVATLLNGVIGASILFFAHAVAAQSFVTVYEFFAPTLNHYFRTANNAEANNLRANPGLGWNATGLDFVAFSRAAPASGASDVCRFYGHQTIGPNSHFYTASAGECSYLKALQAQTPFGVPRWNYEEVAFSADVVPAGSSCPARSPVPVYRLYNNRAAQNDSNHRYTTQLSIYDQLRGQGWSGEGIVMCAVSALSGNPSALPSGGILKTNVIGVQHLAASTVITFELDVFVVNRSGQFFNSLNATAFTIDGFTGSGGAISFSAPQSFLSAAQTFKGPYSALLVLDQSGSISSTDPNDSRIDATKIFLGALGAGEYAALAAFASNNSSYPNRPTLLSGFTTSGPSLFPLVDGLKGKVNGGTPLYQSLLNSISYARSNGPTTNRAVVVLTDGDDTEGGATIDQIVSASLSQQVPVYTVGLSNGTNVSVLGEIAGRTNGALMQAIDARQLVSIYGTLGKILSGTGQYYRIRWQSVWNQVVGPGSTFVTSVKVSTPDGLVYVPFGVRLP